MALKNPTIQTFVDNITLSDDPTEYTSDSIDVAAWAQMLLFLDLSSSGSPTTLQIFVEFYDDIDNTWYEYRNEFFANFLYEDTALSSGINHCISYLCPGSQMRVRIVGTGTDASNTFTATIRAQFFNV